uniref:Uncharacterized protein n=1 Tax=Caenorhabditis japonica TaxID=281687 RepID=A0A8R1I604_CAEJA
MATGQNNITSQIRRRPDQMGNNTLQEKANQTFINHLVLLEIEYEEDEPRSTEPQPHPEKEEATNETPTTTLENKKQPGLHKAQRTRPYHDRIVKRNITYQVSTVSSTGGRGECCKLGDAKEDLPHATPLPRETAKKGRNSTKNTRKTDQNEPQNTLATHRRTSTYLNLRGGKFDVQAPQGTRATVTRPGEAAAGPKIRIFRIHYCFFFSSFGESAARTDALGHILYFSLG